jgi:hypothetical protein
VFDGVQVNMSASATGWRMLRCAIVSVTITLQPALTVDCEQQSAAGNTELAESGSAQTTVRSTAIEKALGELRARFPNAVVVGFEEPFDQRPETEPQVDLGPKGLPLEEVLNRIRKIDPKYRIELLQGGMLHVYPAQKTADPVGLLDIRLAEFSMPQDSCLEQAIGDIDERFRGYAPELTRFLAQRKERWYRSHRRQIPGVVGNILGDCIGSAAPGPVYSNISVRQALDLMAKRSLQVSRGEVTPNSPVHPPYKPLSWRFRFHRDADSVTGLGGIPVFQTFE